MCRQPYDDRFMICCDCCEEWFHGKCVGISKVQGRKFEKLKQEWFCSPCSEGIKAGTERAVLKNDAIHKREQLEASEREAKKTNNRIKDDNKSSNIKTDVVKKRKIKTEAPGNKSPTK